MAIHSKNESIHSLNSRERIDHLPPTPTSPISRSSPRLRKPPYSSSAHSSTSRQNTMSSPPASSFLALNPTPTSVSSPPSRSRNISNSTRRRRSTSLAKPGPIEILSVGDKPVARNGGGLSSHFHQDVGGLSGVTPQWTSTGSIDANLFLLSSSAGKRRIDEELEADEVKDDEFDEDDDEDEDDEMDDDSKSSTNNGATKSASSKKAHKKRGEVFRCEKCSKQYRHPQCLIKHRWQHTEYWNEASKLMLSKHQQVQMLEAAAILSNPGSLPEEKSLWPAAVSSPTSGLFGSDTLNSETIRRMKYNAKSVPTHPSHMNRKASISSTGVKRESDEDGVVVDDEDLYDEEDNMGNYRRRDHSSADTSSSGGNNKASNGQHLNGGGANGSSAAPNGNGGDMEMDGDDMFSLEFEHGNEESTSSGGYNIRNSFNNKYSHQQQHPYLRSPPAGAQHPYMLPSSPPQASFALGSAFPAVSAPVMGFFERRDSPHANSNNNSSNNSSSNYTNNNHIHNHSNNHSLSTSVTNNASANNNVGIVEVEEEYNPKIMTSGLRGRREQSVEMED